jgi:hypothetical protein
MVIGDDTADTETYSFPHQNRPQVRHPSPIENRMK